MKDHKPEEPARASPSDSPEGSTFRPRGGDAIRQLRQSLEVIQRESASLTRAASSLDEFVRLHEARFCELEQELNDTALLYVASYQLHARGDAKEVIKHIRELLEQLVGVEQFALYLLAPSGQAVPVTSRAMSTDELVAIRANESPLHEALTSKTPLMLQEGPLPQGTLSAPLATIPLMLRERAVGAIVILKLFDHKSRWAHVDQQLFQLLSTHAAAALVAAYMYQRQSDLVSALAGLGESLK
jgi:GAF domain-containing protein